MVGHSKALKELNLEGCNKLIILDISSDIISEYDVSEFKNLESLYVFFPNIKEIDISKNQKLLTLNCSGSGLETLNRQKICY